LIAVRAGGDGQGGAGIEFLEAVVTVGDFVRGPGEAVGAGVAPGGAAARGGVDGEEHELTVQETDPRLRVGFHAAGEGLGAAGPRRAVGTRGPADAVFAGGIADDNEEAGAVGDALEAGDRRSAEGFASVAEGGVEAVIDDGEGGSLGERSGCGEGEGDGSDADGETEEVVKRCHGSGRIDEEGGRRYTYRCVEEAEEGEDLGDAGELGRLGRCGRREDLEDGKTWKTGRLGRRGGT